MVRLEVYNPAGLVEAIKSSPHAPRLASLKGKTICEISNGLWEHQRTFPLIRELLQKQLPDTTFIPYTELPAGSHLIDVDDIADVVLQKGCDAAIGGNAA